jgi:GH15 family glucan-1,4-alpha-glucosidase
VTARRQHLSPKMAPIDWLCWPRFDSGACFAALLGDANNGRWRITPAASGAEASARIRRRYRRDTLILETEFTTADGGGAVVLIDFMPVRGGRAWSQLVRLVVGKRGTVPMRMELIVRFGYGGWAPWVTRSETGDLLAIAGPDMLFLRTPVELRGERLTTVGDFAVSAGQRVPFVLTYVPSHLPLPEPVDADDALRFTEEFWRSWASACRSPEQHAEIIAWPTWILLSCWRAVFRRASFPWEAKRWLWSARHLPTAGPVSIFWPTTPVPRRGIS